MKILIIDIETAPKVAYVWRFWKQNVGAKQVLDHGHIMSFAAKWLGNDKIIYEECRKEDDKKLVKSMVKLLDKADMVVAHNGIGFDFPQIAGRALVHGIDPPSPYKMLDTLKVARSEFGFGANSLAYLADILGCAKKGGHVNYPGFELWLACLRGDDKAWKEMEEYNIQDVLTLEEIYIKMRPWMRKHPNVVVDKDVTEVRCPKCGSKHIHFRGYAHTNVGRYHRFKCNDCGGWGRTRYTVLPMAARKALAANVNN